MGRSEAAKKPGKLARGKYFFYPVAAGVGQEHRKSVPAKHPVKPHAERENQPREDYFPSGRSLAAAVSAVTATYAYFLIFAQFGFLHALSEGLGRDHALLRPVMAVMGGAGIAGSGLMAWLGRTQSTRAGMTAGFLIAGAAAGLTWVARTPAWFLVAAALTGLGTGLITVGLAGRLRRETGGERLGGCLGLGTGLAYAICNLPPVFAASATAQAALGIAAACLGLIAVQGFEQRAPAPPTSGRDYEPWGILAWILVLLVLVTSDSAMFYVIQHTPGLKAATWTGTAQLLLNAAAHLAAGLLVGFLLDRRKVAAATGGAAFLLVLGGVLIFAGWGAAGAPLYAAGVSGYSAVLVFYPARHGRVGLAALVYAVAGWLGSALGLGLAEKVGQFPGWVLLLPVGLLAGGWVVRGRTVQ